MNKKQVSFLWIGATLIIFFGVILVISIQRHQLIDAMMDEIIKITPYNANVFNDMLQEKQMASWVALGCAGFIFFITSLVGLGVYLNGDAKQPK